MSAAFDGTVDMMENTVGSREEDQKPTEKENPNAKAQEETESQNHENGSFKQKTEHLLLKLETKARDVPLHLFSKEGQIYKQGRRGVHLLKEGSKIVCRRIVFHIMQFDDRIGMNYNESSRSSISFNSFSGGNGGQLTKKALLEHILPIIDETTVLITDFRGHRVLCSVPLSEENKELLLQDIKILEIDKLEEDIKSNTGQLCENYSFHPERKALAYIVEVDDHFLTVLITTNSKCICLFDSLPNSKGLKKYPDLREILQSCYPGSTLIDIACPNQDRDNALAHAYLNARVVTWGFNEYAKKDELKQFLEDAVQSPILSTVNANMLQNYANLHVANYKQHESKKEKVQDIIAEKVKGSESLEIVHTELARQVLIKTNRDFHYIKNTYIEQCLILFLDDIIRLIKTKHTELSQAFQLVHSIDDITGSFFEQIGSYNIFKICKDTLMNETQKLTFLEDFSNICLGATLKANAMFRKKAHFITELIQCLKYCFLKDVTLFGKVTGKSEPGSFIIELSTSFNDFQPIKNCKSIWDCSDEVLREAISHDFLSIMRVVRSHPEVNIKQRKIHGNDSKFEAFYQSSFVNLKDALQQIKDKLAKTNTKIGDVMEVRIFALELLLVNDSFQWHGTNFVIVSKEIVVDGTCKWDVSGKSAEPRINTNKASDVSTQTKGDSEHRKEVCQGENKAEKLSDPVKERKAPNGKEPGEDGCAGEHGCHGESGGNVLIVTDRLVNAENLTIKSNGGDASDGQDGGDGKDGKDGENGKGFTRGEFEQKFPDPALLSIANKSGKSQENNNTCRNSCEALNKNEHETPFRELRDGNFFRVQDNVLQDLQDVCVGGFYQNLAVNMTRNVVRQTGVVGALFALNPIIFTVLGVTTVASCVIESAQSYCICYGSKGKSGQKGGDGGSGGNAGLGGYAGDMQIQAISDENKMTSKQEFRKLSKEMNQGKDGNRGTDGKGGRGGKHGKNGEDNARVTESAHGKTHWYETGHLKLEYRGNKKGEGHGAYCSKEEKYAYIKKVIPNNRNTVKGTNVVNKKMASGEVRENQLQQRRQETIVKKHILTHFQQALKTNSLDVFSSFEVIGLKNDTDENNQQHSKMKHHSHFNRLLMLRHDNYLLSDLTQLYCPSKVKCEEPQLKYINTIDGEITSTSDTPKLQALINACNNNGKSISMWQGQLENFRKVTRNDNDDAYLLWNIKNLECVIQLFQKLEICLRCNIVDESRTWTEFYDFAITTKNHIENLSLTHADEATLTSIKQYLQRAISSLESIVTVLLYKWMFICLQDINKTTLLKSDHKYKSINQSNQNIWTYAVSEIMQKLDKEEIDEFARNVCEVSDKLTATEADTGEYTASDGAESSTIDNIASEDDTTRKEDDTTRKEDDKAQNFMSLINLLPINAEAKLCLEKLSFLQYKGIDVIKKILLVRIGCEGLHLSLTVPRSILKILVTSLISYDEDHDGDLNIASELTRIFGFTKQSQWLQEYVLVQLRAIFGYISLEDELRDLLSKVEHESWILLLSLRLSSGKENKLTFSLETVKELILVVQKGKLDEHSEVELKRMHLRDWSSQLCFLREFDYLESLPVKYSKDLNTMIAACYVGKLRNRHGSKFMEKLKLNLNTNKHFIDENHVQLLLKNLSSNRWPANNETLQVVKLNSGNNWECELESGKDQVKDHDIVELFEMMKADSNNSLSKDKFDQVQKLVESMKSHSNKSSKLTNNSQEPTPICKFNVGHIKYWSDILKSLRKGNKNIIDENIPEILAVINRSIELKKGFKLRDTQNTAIVLFLVNKGMLEQVSTGEGKTLIIVALAIIKCLNDETVDIITSSSVLSKRDAKEHKDIYELFDITVSHNCSEDIEERRNAYMCSVVYGEIVTFQRDILLDEFYEENILGTRRNENVIVDEVDSMLLDKGQYVLYLSHNVAGLDSLEQVYVYIWSFVNAKGMIGTTEDEETVYEMIMDAMFGIVRKEDIKSKVNKKVSTPSGLLDDLWKVLIKNKLIDQNGRVLKSKHEINMSDIAMEWIYGVDKHYIEGCIKSALKEVVLRGPEFPVPGHLEAFIKLHVKEWITNAFRAKNMIESTHYKVDMDMSSEYQEYSQVIIMDISTGTEQYNSHWNQGLHQFLQLKHGCRFSPESLKAVFMSNITFFKRYNPYIYGMTGTLGMDQERSLLQELYGIDYVTVPRFRQSRFIEEDGTVCISRGAWVDEVTKCVAHVSKSRPVLVICETIKEAEILEKHFHKEKETSTLHVYKHSYDKLEVLENKSGLEKGCIILATNLAGRGTDIEIADDTFGGLFVCLTYLPSNIRVEQQAYGRTARKGQQGSGKMIILKPSEEEGFHSENDLVRLMTLLSERNLLEQRRISKLKVEYETKTRPEEKIFKQFENEFKILRKELTESVPKKFKGEVAHLLQSLLERWALWLDSERYNIECGNDVSCSLSEFLKTSVKKAKETVKAEKKPNSICGTLCDVVRGSQNLIKLGTILICDQENNERALKVFDRVIKHEPRFSEAAYYYKAYCLLKLRGDHDAIRECFNQAKILMKNRIDDLETLTIMVRSVSEQYSGQNSLLIEDGYEEQKQGQKHIYEVFLQSIDDACGHEVTPRMILDIVGNTMQARIIYDDLFREGILVDNKLDPNFEVKLCQLREQYFLYFENIKRVLRKENRKALSVDTLAHVLPSREEFWSCLKEAGVLKTEDEFVIIDMNLMKQTGLDHVETSEELTKIMHKIIREDMVSSSDSAVWLYPEYVANGADGNVVTKRECFEATFGHVRAWKALEEQNVIYFNKCAKLNEKINIDNVLLNKYDHIDHKAFTIIDDIDDEDSYNIFQMLQKQQILKCNRTSTRLQTSEELRTIDLGRYQHYKVEVINVLRKCFQYRIALKKLIKDGEHSLHPKPHISLFRDLISHGIVTPVRVSKEFDDDKIEKSLHKLYGVNRMLKGVALKKLYGVVDTAADMCDHFEINAHPFTKDISLAELKERCKSVDEHALLYKSDLQQLLEASELNFSVQDMMATLIETVWIARESWISLEMTNRQRLLADQKKVHEELEKFQSSSLREKLMRRVFPYRILVDEDEILKEWKEIKIHLPILAQIFLLGRVRTKQFCSLIKDSLSKWKSGLEKFDSVDVKLIDLYVRLDRNTIHSLSGELDILSSNGLDHVVSLFEEKWTAACFAKIATIVFFALFQIAVGLLIEVKTVGLLTHVGAGFMSEGVNDILYAIQCLYSGFCSLKAYAKQKVVSVAITIVTGSVAAWFSRGTKVSRFGYKIGGEDMIECAGKDLVSAATKTGVTKEGVKVVEHGAKVVAKEALIKAGKKIVGAAVLGLANIGIEKAIECYVEQKLYDFSELGIAEFITNFDDDIKNYNLKGYIEDLQKARGKERTKQIISKIKRDILQEQQLWEEMCSNLKRLAKAVSSGISQAAKKMRPSNNKQAEILSMVSTIVSGVLTASGILSSLHEIFSGWEFVKNISDKIKDEVARCNPQEGQQGHPIDENLFSEFRDELKQILQDKVTKNLRSDFIKPAMDYCSSKVIEYGTIGLKQMYHKTITLCHKRKFERIKKKKKKQQDTSTDSNTESNSNLFDSVNDDYNRELMQLLRKVRDPELFASIIREGVPVDRNCTQAVAELTGRRIIIKESGEDGTNAIAKEFTPSDGSACGEPIVLDFHAGQDGIGHFSTPGSEIKDTSGTKQENYDCLFEALQAQGVQIDREDVASKIETDPNIRTRIELGWHNHYIGKGGVGGKKRPPKRWEKVNEWVDDICSGKWKPDPNSKKNQRDQLKDQLLDKGLRCHELIPRDVVADLAFDLYESKGKSDFAQKSEITRCILEMHMNLRVPTQNLIYSDEVGNLCAHSGTMESNKGVTKGQKQFHDDLRQNLFEKGENRWQLKKEYHDVTKLKNELHVISVDYLIQHVEMTDPGRIKTDMITEGTKTKTGHDLGKKTERERYFGDVNCDRYKVLEVAKWDCENALKELGDLNTEQAYAVKRTLKERVNKINSLQEGLGKRVEESRKGFVSQIKQTVHGINEYNNPDQRRTDILMSEVNNLPENPKPAQHNNTN